MKQNKILRVRNIVIKKIICGGGGASNNMLAGGKFIERKKNISYMGEKKNNWVNLFSMLIVLILPSFRWVESCMILGIKMAREICKQQHKINCLGSDGVETGKGGERKKI